MKQINIDSRPVDYEGMSHHDACFDVGGCSEKGTIFHDVTIVKTIASKNKVDLRAIQIAGSKTIAHYEIYVEGVFFTRYYDEKKARKLWKDFAA